MTLVFDMTEFLEEENKKNLKSYADAKLIKIEKKNIFNRFTNWLYGK